MYRVHNNVSVNIVGNIVKVNRAQNNVSVIIAGKTVKVFRAPRAVRVKAVGKVARNPTAEKIALETIVATLIQRVAKT